MSLHQFRKKYGGAYVVSLDNKPVFAVADIDKILDALWRQSPRPSTVDIELAPEDRTSFDDRPAPLHLRMHDLQHICALQSTAGEGMTADERRVALDSFASDLSPTDLTEYLQHRLQTDGMTNEERALPRFTRPRLQSLSNWPEWDACFDAQLDNHRETGAILPPVLRSSIKTDEGKRPNILRMHWNNVVKPEGDRKCRSCMDGSKRAAPHLRQFVQTYASCVEQPCQRLFFALSAGLDFLVRYGDTKNAYQQSPPPTVPCFLEIDDAYASWYKKNYGHDIDRRKYVIPLGRAFQEHPEAGALWERLIVRVLEGDELRFKSTTHERNLYHGTIDGELVLVCRQVDDFSVASKTLTASAKVLAIINKHATTEDKGIGLRDDDGMTARFNGIDVHQTQDYIKLSCKTYIDRLLQTHGWEKTGTRESDRYDAVPLSSDAAKQLDEIVGPSEGTKEHRDLEKKVGYSFRQVLGELIYAYVVCRLDIGFAVAKLAQHSQAPAEIHYKGLKDVIRYLRRTKDWGLIYWRPTPNTSLPYVDLEEPPDWDESLPPFPIIKCLLRLLGFVDAAHATDLTTRRSMTGYVFCLAGGAIAYKSKRQATVATSSTEAEFIGGVSAGKVAKYLRSVLQDLNIPQDGPTPLYMDNQAAIAMINENKPTERSRHIDVQHFAIQEWRRRGIIEMRYIAGSINPSDQATKAVGSTLHHRHARRSMGHYRPPP